ncbi:MAG: hypothetical protein Q8Q09_10245 [Deltaproteobacteria bacterium]|nr:hypothetical protein [Deltaproteobacteria bacterium]
MAHRSVVLLLGTLLSVTCPQVALAQSPALARARAATPEVAVVLTREGVFATPSECVRAGQELVDAQRVDVDGDGDLDMVALVELSEGADVTRAGRGAVVLFAEPQGWRALTVASVAAMPFENGYNWGPVVRGRQGASAALELLYSAADAGRFAEASYWVRPDGATLRVTRKEPAQAVVARARGRGAQRAARASRATPDAG